MAMDTPPPNAASSRRPYRSAALRASLRMRDDHATWLDVVPVGRALPGESLVIVLLGLFAPADIGVLLALRRQYRLAI